MLRNNQLIAPILGTEAKVGSEYRLMLFELSIDGHYPSYIQHLVRYWGEQELPGSLDIVVSPQFRKQNSDIVDSVQNYGSSNINFIPITPEEETVLNSNSSALNRSFRAFQEWHLIYKYAVKLKPNHCLLMYFDTRQLPLALGAKLPCPFSSIYFRPTFHYDNFNGYIPGWKDRLRQWREKLFLSRIFKQTQLKALFCLDPFVIKHLDKFSGKTKVVYLPDPVQEYQYSESYLKKLREDLGIEPHRQVFLLFGRLTRRKGIEQLLESIHLLPPPLCQKLCLLLVGVLGSTQADKLQWQLQIAELSKSLPIQVIINDQFVPDQNIQAYFNISNVILCPYQRHVGMSGILLRAAAARKPVLAQSYGLMGEITRHHQLGLPVNSTVPREIAQGLTRFLLDSPNKLCDRSKMRAFAEQNSAEKFAKVIFQYLKK